MTTIKTWTEATVLRVAPPADHKASEFTAWHPAIRRFGVRFRRAGDGRFGPGTYTAIYHQGGRDRPVSIGKVGAVTLEVAIAEAHKVFGSVAQHRDPRAERAKAKAVFDDVFKASIPGFVGHMAACGLNDRYIATTERYLTRYFPGLSEASPRLITRAQCADALRRLLEPGPGWTGGKAVYVQGGAALSAYFEWLLGEGRIDANPCAGIKRKCYLNPPVERTLTEAELRAVWNAIDGTTRTGRLFKLLVLTGARRDQIGQLRKEWLDLDAAIPVVRFPASARRGGSKNGETFILPLSRQAVAILRAQLQTAAATDYVFGHPMAVEGFQGYEKAMVALRKSAAVEHWSLHDLRRTFVTLGLERLQLDPMLLDACLNHRAKLVTQSTVGSIYQRARLVEARVPVVQAWADYCDSLTTAPKLRLVAA
jgi:integrase